MPTLPSADELTAPSPARLDYPEVAAAAIAICIPRLASPSARVLRSAQEPPMVMASSRRPAGSASASARAWRPGQACGCLLGWRRPRSRRGSRASPAFASRLRRAGVVGSAALTAGRLGGPVDQSRMVPYGSGWLRPRAQAPRRCLSTAACGHSSVDWPLRQPRRRIGPALGGRRQSIKTYGRFGGRGSLGERSELRRAGFLYRDLEMPKSMSNVKYCDKVG